MGRRYFMALLAVFSVLLNRYSGQDDILVGTPVAGRTRQRAGRVDRVLREHVGAEESMLVAIRASGTCCLASGIAP